MSGNKGILEFWNFYKVNTVNNLQLSRISRESIFSKIAPNTVIIILVCSSSMAVTKFLGRLSKLV